MSLFSGFKSIFIGDEDIEEEMYSTYTPKPPVIPDIEKEDGLSDMKPGPVDTPASAQAEPPSAARRTQNQQRRAQAQPPAYDRTERSDRSESRAPASRQPERYNNTRTRNNERESDVRMTTTVQSSSIDLVLARPNNFKEVSKIGEDINQQKTVILNLELVKQEDATRILDFIWGVAFANDAEIKMMAQKTYAVIPSGVNFSGVDLVSELESNGYSF